MLNLNQIMGLMFSKIQNVCFFPRIILFCIDCLNLLLVYCFGTKTEKID